MKNLFLHSLALPAALALGLAAAALFASNESEIAAVPTPDSGETTIACDWPKRVEKENSLEDDTYAVYASILQNYEGDGVIMVEERTSLVAPVGRIPLDYRKAYPSEMFRNYELRNKRSQKLSDQFHLNDPEIILLVEEQANARDRNIDDGIITSSGDGDTGPLIAFSSVGFSKFRDQAVVSFSVSLRAGESREYIVFLNKLDDGTWDQWRAIEL